MAAQLQKRANTSAFDHIIGVYKEPTSSVVSDQVAESVRNLSNQYGKSCNGATESTESMTNHRNGGKPTFSGVDFGVANKQNFYAQKSSGPGFNSVFVHCPVETASAAGENMAVLVIFDHWPKVYYSTPIALQTCAFACSSTFNNGDSPPKWISAIRTFDQRVVEHSTSSLILRKKEHTHTKMTGRG